MNILRKCATQLNTIWHSWAQVFPGENLTIRKYFNQRLLDADGRFAKGVEYLPTAQYAVESKQVNDDANIILHQTQGRWYRGHS